MDVNKICKYLLPCGHCDKYNRHCDLKVSQSLEPDHDNMIITPTTEAEVVTVNYDNECKIPEDPLVGMFI